MKPLFSNSTVRWNAREIACRDALILEIPTILETVWSEIRDSIRFVRTETPMLTTSSFLESHIETGFDLVKTELDDTYLRPETTIGTFESFRQDFPFLQKDLARLRDSVAKAKATPKNEPKPRIQIPKYLPICYWQAGKSFRNEKNSDTMRATKLRLSEFWQMEFQLFCLPDTKAPYIEKALEALTKRYGGKIVEADELPHYSTKTLDWEIKGLEVAGCSIRSDFEGLEVHEIAIGLDRLTALICESTK